MSKSYVLYDGEGYKQAAVPDFNLALRLTIHDLLGPNQQQPVADCVAQAALGHTITQPADDQWLVVSNYNQDSVLIREV